MVQKCKYCGKLHERSSKRCRPCVDKESERQRKQYQERLSNGLCPRCGKQPMYGNKHCDNCATRVRDKGRKVRSSRLDKGMCASCGQNSPTDGLKTCDQCLLRLGNSRRNRIDKLDNSGTCVRCGQFPQLSGRTRFGNPHTTCQTCYLKHISLSNLKTQKYADVLLIKFEAQNSKCPYTGEKLAIGGNAWVDHIMPRSRFPELTTDPDNVEWVTEAVNRAKQDRTQDEFLALVKQIHDYRKL